MINVEANGRHYQEMNVDAGVVQQALLYPMYLGVRASLKYGDLSFARLDTADMRDVDFEAAKIHRATRDGTNFRGANIGFVFDRPRRPVALCSSPAAP